MLPPPYPNMPHHHHHYHCSSHQETAAFPSPAMTFDEYGRFLPADMYNQETLEAVLRQTVTAPVPAEAEVEVEVEQEREEPADGGRGGAVAGAAGAPRKRPFRTDRHSKIRTAHGVRDRRMRLSVGVARDFFALQDRLGFDKASKTVDWLLTQSRPAIDRLAPPVAPAAAAPATGAAGPALKDKWGAGTGSSSNAGGFRARARERGCDGSPAALMEERARGGRDREVDWYTSEAAAAEQPIDGWEYYYQYCQLEEMMRAATTKQY